MKRNIELHIEELVLHGFAHSDRWGIGEAVERELSRLFIENDFLPSLEDNTHIHNLNGGEFAVAQGAKADIIGTLIAQSVYKGINASSNPQP